MITNFVFVILYFFAIISLCLLFILHTVYMLYWAAVAALLEFLSHAYTRRFNSFFTQAYKSVFSYLHVRTLTTRHCPLPHAASAAIGRYVLHAGPTAANPPHAAAASKWDRQSDTHTDGRTPYSVLEPRCQK